MSSLNKDRNNQIEYRNSKKMNFKSICITKRPPNDTTSFDEIKEICSIYGRIHSVHETVKNCPYSFINFEFLENEDELAAALNDIGVECQRGKRKQENLPVPKKKYLLAVDDLKVFGDEVSNHNQYRLESTEDWNEDNDKVDSFNADPIVAESVESSWRKHSKFDMIDSLYRSNMKEKEDSPEKKPAATVPCSALCVHCQGNASLVCKRCGDYYCSKECQESDWSTHRYICFSMP